MLYRVLTVGLVAVLVAGGCTSGGDSAAEETTSSTAVPTTVPPTTSTTAATTTTPEDLSERKSVFTWGDDPADWFSQDEMTDTFEGVLPRRSDGTPHSAVLEHEPDDEGWSWEYGGWTIHVHEVGALAKTKTDPRLPRGVRYQAASGWAYGGYMLSGPASDEAVCMHIWPSGGGPPYPPKAELDAYEDDIFALASTVLKKMGWAE